MIAAAGWVAYVRKNGAFKQVAYAAVPLTTVTSAFRAEVIALDMASRFVSELDAA